MVLFTSLIATFAGLLTIVPTAVAAPAYSLALPYKGVKVFRVPTGPSEESLEDLRALIAKLDLSSWTAAPVVNSHVDLEVPNNKLQSFTTSIHDILENSGARANGFEIETMHEDLAESILAESEGMDSPVVDAVVGLANDAWFNSYHPYADHLTFLNDLVSAFPSKAKIVTSGTSVAGRAITGIHIFGSSGSGTKPAIIWHGTVHAREWIATMVVEYLAYSLLNNYSNSTTVKGFVDNYDFYIFPVVNPDGFIYTQTTTRLWRKNRQSPPSGSTCYGRDVNRNWDAFWSVVGGASSSPCDETYKGLAPGDAPETVGLAAFVSNLINSTAGVKSFIDWHSYSQIFVTPWGYTCDSVPADNDELTSLAAGFANALRKVHGTRFQTGPICPTIYQATGTTVDWAHLKGVKYSFAAELRDTGANGFILPASQIRPSGEEVWAGIQYLLDNFR